MFHARGVDLFRIFFRKGASVFVTFSSVIFSADLSNLSTKNDPKGDRGHVSPGKFLENLHTAMTILVLFKQLLKKDCHIFGP